MIQFHLFLFYLPSITGLYLYMLVVKTFSGDNIRFNIYAIIGWGKHLLYQHTTFASIFVCVFVQQMCLEVCIGKDNCILLNRHEVGIYSMYVIAPRSCVGVR